MNKRDPSSFLGYSSYSKVWDWEHNVRLYNCLNMILFKPNKLSQKAFLLKKS